MDFNFSLMAALSACILLSIEIATDATVQSQCAISQLVVFSKIFERTVFDW
jgi:hypothetical protein